MITVDNINSNNKNKINQTSKLYNNNNYNNDTNKIYNHSLIIEPVKKRVK